MNQEFLPYIMKERVQVQVFHEETFNNIYKFFSGFAGAGYKCARPGRAGKSVCPVGSVDGC